MAELIRYLDKFTARKVQDDHTRLLETLPDSLEAWITQYMGQYIHCRYQGHNSNNITGMCPLSAENKKIFTCSCFSTCFFLALGGKQHGEPEKGLLISMRRNR
jgi:hypothetical protein